MKKHFNLSTVAIVACLAVTVAVFVSCDKKDDSIKDDPIDEGTEQDANIVAFTFDGIDGRATIDKAALTVTARAGRAGDEVDLTELVANFTLSVNATATVGGKAQVSGQTANNFTSPVTYRVTSGDGATTNDWTVTVTGTEGPAGESDFTRRSFANNEEKVAFMPAGIYYWINENGVEQFLYAKGDDNSIVFNGGSGNGGHIWDVYTPQNAHYHLVLNNVEPDPDNLWYAKIFNYPLTPNADYPYTSALFDNADYGIELKYNMVMMVGLGSLYAFEFISSSQCEAAHTSKSSETLLGFQCTKYTYKDDYTTQDFWVLSNGFCLKYRMYLEVPGMAPVESISGFSRIDRDCSDYNAIMEKLDAGASPVEDVRISSQTRWQSTWFHDYYPEAYDSHATMKVIPYNLSIAAMQVAYSYEGNWNTPSKVVYIQIQTANTTRAQIDAYCETLMAQVPYLTYCNDNGDIGELKFFHASNDCLTSDWNCPTLDSGPTYSIEYKVGQLGGEGVYYIHIFLRKTIAV
ncbi:MAG: hypothetical protein LBQ31_04070 [Bacteroidales bacterium]|jgi:hypothetical protein|nr:hypothetical protein [Bacteroidales bacterium]